MAVSNNLRATVKPATTKAITAPVATQKSEAKKALDSFEDDAVSLQRMNDGLSGKASLGLMSAAVAFSAMMAMPKSAYAAPAAAPPAKTAPAPARQMRGLTDDDTMNMIYEQLGVKSDFRALGMTEDAALIADGDTKPGASACSSKHDQGDWSNMFCHAAIGKAVGSEMQKHGFSSLTSDLTGAAVLFAKEAILDKNIDPSDIFFSHTFELQNNKDRRVSVELSFNGDGAVFGGIQVDWNSK